MGLSWSTVGVPPEMGAILLTALDAARTAIPPEPIPEGGPAGPPDVAATNADALVMMAETLLAGGGESRTGGDRYQVIVNVDADVKSRTIPPALRRAVHVRDEGCRFPGCGARRFIDVQPHRHHRP